MHQPYPFDALLQQLPGTIANIVLAVAHQAGVPPAMALASVVNAVATALQRRLALKLPNGEVEPLLRIDLVLGEPECGKNTLLRLTHGPIRAFDKKVEEIRSKAGLPALSRPLLLESDKPAELIEAIEGHARATTISLVDGGMLLASPYFRRDKQRTCSLWDGHGRFSQRNTQGRLCVAVDPSVSFLALPQSGPWRNYLDRYGAGAVDGGLLQRCSITFQSPSSQDNIDVDPAWISAYHQSLAEFLGDAEAYAMEEKVELVPVEFSEEAARDFIELEHRQTRARRAGSPGPWRALQKAVRTSLPFEILMAAEIPGASPSVGEGDDHCPAGSKADPRAVRRVHVPDRVGNGQPNTNESLTAVAPSQRSQIEALLGTSASSACSKPADGAQTGEPSPVANLQVSKRAFEAAIHYVEWQHSQPGFRAMQDVAKANPNALPPAARRNSSSSELRLARLLDDADAIMHCVEGYLARTRDANIAAMIGRPHLREVFAEVREQDIAIRCGLYSARFKRALAHLLDESYLKQYGSGRLAKLSRTGRHYAYWRAAALTDSPL